MEALAGVVKVFYAERGGVGGGDVSLGRCLSSGGSGRRVKVGGV